MSRHYSDEEKRLILDRLILNGGDVALTSQETGVNDRTIHRWRNQYHPTLTTLTTLTTLATNPPQPDPVGAAFWPSDPTGEDTPDPLEPFIPPMTDKAHDLLASVGEAIEDATLNQRVAALVQILDRIERWHLRSLRSRYLSSRPPGEDVQIVYEYEVEGHVEKEDDLEDNPPDQAEDQTPYTPPEPAYRAEE